MGVGLPKIASDIRGRQFLAAENFRAKPYPGRVYLFKAESRPDFFCDDPDMGWGKILSDLRVEQVSGDHGTINTGMNLKMLARKLAKFLEDSPSSQAVVQAAASPEVPGVRGTNSLPMSG